MEQTANDKAFDCQKHVDALLEAEGIACNVLMLCEGLIGANGMLEDRQYISAATGAISLIARVMEKAVDLISDAEGKFVSSHGLHYKYQEGGRV
jgi:hypothetical protein